jgi:hypothetical protein
MIHPHGWRNFIPLALVVAIGLSIAGCGGGHSSTPETPTQPTAPEPVYVEITVDGTPYTYNKGPVQKEHTSFTGIASGCFVIMDSIPALMIYGSETEASDQNEGNIFGPNGPCLFIFIANATAAGTYNSSSIEGIWSKDASFPYALNCTQVTIEEYGPVGGRIKGTFSGTYTDSGSATKTFTGRFNVQRFPDDDFCQYFL